MLIENVDYKTEELLTPRSVMTYESPRPVTKEVIIENVDYKTEELLTPRSEQVATYESPRPVTKEVIMENVNIGLRKSKTEVFKVP